MLSKPRVAYTPVEGVLMGIPVARVTLETAVVTRAVVLRGRVVGRGLAAIVWQAMSVVSPSDGSVLMMALRDSHKGR